MRRRSTSSPHREGTCGLREQSKSRVRGFIGFLCKPRNISLFFLSLFFLLYFLIIRPRIIRFQSIIRPVSSLSMMPSTHLILCRPLLLPPSVFPSIKVFSNESTLCVRWPNYWSFSVNIICSNEHSGLITFRMDWLALLAVQGTLKSLLQHHRSKASILRRSAFFTVQLSHPYMTTGKNHSLD